MSYEALYQRLLAEAETWPLATELAFQKVTLQLGREGVCTLDSETRALAEGLENHLRLRAGGMSLGSLERLRDGAWFGEQSLGPNSEKIPLATYLYRLAARYLDSADEEVFLRGRGQDIYPDLLAHWRWLSLLVPADLLLSARLAQSNSTPPSDYVSLQPSALKEVLSEKVAETHLHATAAFGFPLLWTSWAAWFRDKKIPALKLEASPDIPFGSESDFAKMLTVAFLTRALMGRFLATWKSGSGSFGEFQLAPLEMICAETSKGQEGALQLANLCRRSIDELNGPSKEPLLEEVQRAYRDLTEGIPLFKRQTQAQVIQQDPLAAFVPSSAQCLPETWFASKALRYLLSEGSNDLDFAKAFWQYQRIRCLSFRFLVEEAGTAGLDWFQRHFSRLVTLRAPLDLALYDAVFESTRRGLSLHAVELRLAPKKSANKLREEFYRILNAAVDWTVAEESRPEIGVLYHFLKERNPKGQPSLPHADPGIEGDGFRFGRWYTERCSEADALLGLLSLQPDALLVVRGLDVASSELAIPTWATVELINKLRRESIRILRKHGRRRSYGNLRPLRVTYHAGEEYQRLVEGLRRLHELIEFKVVRCKDRIGHGLALGVRVKDWIREAPETFQPIEDRLDDLLWELERYVSEDVSPPQGRLAWVETTILELGTEIYGDDVTLDALLRARRARHDPGILARLGFPNRVSQQGGFDHSSRLLHIYLTSRDAYRRGQRLVRVRAGADGELLFLVKVQKWLKQKFARMNITVEVNPTSNLLIANLQGMKHHPIVRLSGSSSELRFSINSDDPLTFATSLSEEYTYLYGELCRRSKSNAISRLNSLRENGWLSRFTLPESASKANLQSVLGQAPSSSRRET